MTTSPANDPKATAPQAKLESLARRAAWVLVWESIWPPLAWAGVVCALFLSASWFGLWYVTPPLARALGLLAFALALGAALAPLVRLRWPSRAAALSRLDRDAGGAHSPASGFEDRLANQQVDETTSVLWAMHRERLAREVEALAVAPPSPRMPLRDPRALRFAAILLAIAGGLVAGSERYARVAAAFDIGGAEVASAPARVDAWIDPPPYAGKPPILLKVAAQDAPESIVTPEGSIVVVRADPKEIEARVEGGLAPVAVASPTTASANSPTERRFTLKSDGRLTLLQGGSPLASFKIASIPNAAPVITLLETPQANLSGSLTLHYSLADAYGVASAEADFAKPNGAAPTTRSLVEPPKLSLPLAGSANGVGEAHTTSDLSEHAWAGAQVLMTLKATDLAGLTGQSAPIAVTLPQRRFSNPLAKALVEQRRGLILDPDNDRPRLAKALDALMLAPDVFDTNAGVYLGLRTAETTLTAAHDDKGLIEVADLLWAIALQIEDGDASQAQRDLRAAEQKLRDALQRGASDAEIKALTKELREAAEAYMRELAQQDKNSDPDSAPMNSQDLESMLDRMEDTARNGAKEDAQAMLDQLQDMFENMKSSKEAQDGPAEREMRKDMSELDKLLRDQQALRDETFRRDQRERNRRANPDDGAAPDDKNADSAPLDQRQAELRDRLAELQKKLKSLGLKGEKGFDDAEGAMSEAEGDLKGDSGEPQPGGSGQKGKGGRSGKGDAVEAQGRALEAMRQGAQGLQQQMQGNGGKNGYTTTSRRNGRSPSGRDPLGRGSNGSQGATEGQLNEGPAASERARRVLQELRRRLSDPNRPTDERDYLERLLRRD